MVQWYTGENQTSDIRIDCTQHLEVEVTSLSSSHQCAKDVVLSCVNDLVLLSRSSLCTEYANICTRAGCKKTKNEEDEELREVEQIVVHNYTISLPLLCP